MICDREMKIEKSFQVYIDQKAFLNIHLPIPNHRLDQLFGHSDLLTFLYGLSIKSFGFGPSIDLNSRYKKTLFQ